MSRPPRVPLGSNPACVEGIRSSTSKSGPSDMKDPGKAYAAASGQRDKLGQVAG